MKPILFNTEMVKAILAGRKTQTRRVIKPQPLLNGHFWELGGAGWCDTIKVIRPVPCHSLYNRQPYKPDDILYVRETYCKAFCGNGTLYKCKTCHKMCDFNIDSCYVYKADGENQDIFALKWKPSIHMPKAAARIFLKVTDVTVQRLQDIDIKDIAAEGFELMSRNTGVKGIVGVYDGVARQLDYVDFANYWDGLIHKKDFEKYSWKANPWVWAIEFERIESR
jgi:hypothetical protein